MLFDTLRECSSPVLVLRLYQNYIDDKCAKHLCEYLQENEHLEKLWLGLNKITDNTIKLLSENVVGNTSLKELSLIGNKAITDASTPYLIEVIKNSCITQIDLDTTSISKNYLKEIATALEIPIEQRNVSIKSNSKSAAKTS